jgi:hypothetical protein
MARLVLVCTLRAVLDPIRVSGHGAEVRTSVSGHGVKRDEVLSGKQIGKDSFSSSLALIFLKQKRPIIEAKETYYRRKTRHLRFLAWSRTFSLVRPCTVFVCVCVCVCV